MTKQNIIISKPGIPKTNTTLEIKHQVQTIASGYNDSEYLQQYQYIIREYLKKSSSRGILLFHSPGFGKSITAASITEYTRQHEPKRKIVVLLSKSLQDNFRGNIRKYITATTENGKEGEAILERNYKFVSLNASNMYTQMSSIDKSEQYIEYERSLEKLNNQINTGGSFLENSILVIDEVHNLSVSIKNGSKNAIALYNRIMKTKDIKLVFLTGTPIVNTPFELVPLFNMLRGYIRVSGSQTTLFPENEEKFNTFFIDRKNNNIINKSVFQNRITGLCSYYGNYYFGDQRITGFPEEYPLRIITVRMSDYQFIKYQDIRSIEEKEESGRFGTTQKAERFIDKDKSNSKSSYRIRSRQICNFAVPDYARVEVREGNETKVKVNIHKIKSDDLKNLDKYSPKFGAIIDNIKSLDNELCVVYSEFVETGINLLSKVLAEREGYVYWRDNPMNMGSNDIAGSEFDLEEVNINGGANKPIGNQKKSVKSYALISGNVPFSERSNIIRVFNSGDNIDGKLITVLLISKSGSEGLNLKNVRAIHIMEPFWNYARIEQVIARGSRYLSHEALSTSLRNIQPYLYITEYPEDHLSEEPTTDRKLLQVSLAGKILREKFELTLIESSIDCSFHKETLPKDIGNTLDCHLCAPDNKPLYNLDINRDILTNNCTPFGVTEKSVKTVTLDGVDYQYTDDSGITIYEFDNSIGNYIEMRKDNPLYADITKKIFKFN
jgi:superfamily II DNA or RNA helicase